MAVGRGRSTFPNLNTPYSKPQYSAFLDLLKLSRNLYDPFRTSITLCFAHLGSPQTSFMNFLLSFIHMFFKQMSAGKSKSSHPENHENRKDTRREMMGFRIIVSARVSKINWNKHKQAWKFLPSANQRMRQS